jgi:hypothetical protein
LSIGQLWLSLNEKKVIRRQHKKIEGEREKSDHRSSKRVKKEKAKQKAIQTVLQ